MNKKTIYLEKITEALNTIERYYKVANIQDDVILVLHKLDESVYVYEVLFLVSPHDLRGVTLYRFSKTYQSIGEAFGDINETIQTPNSVSFRDPQTQTNLYIEENNARQAVVLPRKLNYRLEQTRVMIDGDEICFIRPVTHSYKTMTTLRNTSEVKSFTIIDDKNKIETYFDGATNKSEIETFDITNEVTFQILMIENEIRNVYFDVRLKLAESLTKDNPKYNLSFILRIDNKTYELKTIYGITKEVILKYTNMFFNDNFIYVKVSNIKEKIEVKIRIDSVDVMIKDFSDFDGTIAGLAKYNCKITEWIKYDYVTQNFYMRKMIGPRCEYKKGENKCGE